MNNKTKILFVLNPKAGTGISADLEKIIRQKFDNNKHTYKILTLSKGKNKDTIKESINEFDPEIVVAGGGDGTVNFLAGILKNTGIKLGILPLGSSNGMAYQMNIPEDIEKALEIIRRKKSMKSDILKINMHQLSLHLSDIGMNARVIKRYKKEGHRGFWGYILQYFKELGNKNKFTCRVKTPEQVIKEKALMVVIANASYYGTGAKINEKGKINDGKFEVIIIESYPVRFLFNMFLSLVLPNYRNNKYMSSVSCQSAQIEVHPEQDLQLDGEPVGRLSGIDVSLDDDRVEIIHN